MPNKKIQLTDELINDLCSFEFQPSKFHGEEIREQIHKYVEKYGKISGLEQSKVKKRGCREYGNIKLNLEDGKKIFGYKDTAGCGCSGSYVATRGKNGHVLKDKKRFTDYFCIGL
ncbi:MAG TPA: hypothetical protein VJB11_01980 [archaeon]|nr:hypothetical protein [archaeon]